MVKQRAVDAGANEVRRILQGGSTFRPPMFTADQPAPDRISGLVSAGGQPLQAAVQMRQDYPAQHGAFAASAVQQSPQVAQTVPLYVGVEAAPAFNLHPRLRGPGALLPTTLCVFAQQTHPGTC